MVKDYKQKNDVMMLTYVPYELQIPINTLGAVSKFLDNNVPARKTIQTADGEVRLRGPARRRANKRVIITNQQHAEADDEQ